VNIIDEKFNSCKNENRPAFIAYITAGDPDFNASLEVMDTLCDAGVDIIELGVPFSDPLADGTANQLAAERALNAGMTPRKVLELAKKAKNKHPQIPLVLFTYMNPIAYSVNISFNDFCKNAKEAGIDAILPLDLPPEELDSKSSENFSYRSAMKDAKLPHVVLVAPNTPESRFKFLTETASSFIYYVSREGVTGENASFNNKFADRIAKLKKITSKPIVVGFGISTPEHVRTAAGSGVDGVVVGSAIVRKIEQLNNNTASLDEIYNFVSSMTEALKCD